MDPNFQRNIPILYKRLIQTLNHLHLHLWFSYSIPGRNFPDAKNAVKNHGAFNSSEPKQ